MKTNQAEFEELVNKCFAELKIAYKEDYSAEKAEKTAAMFLAAQMQLSLFIADIELRARYSKYEIERVEAQKYFEIKESGAVADKKITETALQQFVAKDDTVISAKKENSEAEADLKKYNYLMSSLKESHIFFRGMSKSKFE